MSNSPSANVRRVASMSLKRLHINHRKKPKVARENIHSALSDSAVICRAHEPEEQTHELRVEIIKQIGAGSAGKVFSCYVDGWRCAMKVVEMSKREMLRSGAEISREIEVLEKLPYHPNVVQYMFHKQQEETFQIFLKEYGTSLDHIIEEKRTQQKSFPLITIIDILLDVATGTEFLHSHNIIHRDIKSQNIFVQEGPNNKTTYVLGDLDSAKIISRTGRPLTVIGTPSFMAPEVLTSGGTTEYSLLIDVFSFGMLIFELVALRIPYTEFKPFQVAEKIIQGVPPLLPANLSSDYDVLLSLHSSCINPKSSERPTIHQVITKLHFLRCAASAVDTRI